MSPETDQTKIALIDNNIGFIQKDISEIKSGIKELAGVYITKLQYEVSVQGFNKQFIELHEEIKDLRKSSNIQRILSPLVSSIITAVIVFLAINYLQHLK